jgi:nicotinamidase-related amidase
MTTALLVIDVQESFRARAESWATTSAPDIADRIQPLVEAARTAGHHVVWVLHSEPGTGDLFDPELGHVRLIDGLKPFHHEPVLHKTSHNAFTTTNLGQYLTAHGVTEVVVTGIRTEQCCETTARHASDLGYAVDYVSEATLTFPMTDAAGRQWSAADIKARTELVLAGRFARIATVDEALQRPPLAA